MDPELLAAYMYRDAAGRPAGGDVPITLSNSIAGTATMPVWGQFFRYTTTTPEACTAHGDGVSGLPTVAGGFATFTIQAFAALSSGETKARESGGDFFYVDLWLDGARLGLSLVVDLDPELPYTLQGEGSRLPGAWDVGETEDRLSGFPRLGGTYAAVYEATVAGDYNIHVVSAGREIAGSPFDLTISPAELNEANSLVSIPVRSVVAGERTGLILLQLRDRYGNNRTASYGELSAAASLDPLAPYGSSVVAADEPIVGAVWQFQWAAQLSGAYEVEVSVNGIGVQTDDDRP